jgi:type I restriction enzyme S subunit
MPDDDEKRTVTPKLRFPEFREGKAWEETTISGVCDLRAGKFVAASEIAELPESGLFPCYGGNGLRGYTKSFTHDGH